MSVEKTSRYTGFDIDSKRFYLPFTFKVKCQGCGKEIEENFEDYYLSYPIIGKPFVYTAYHGEDCDTETFIELQLDIDLKIIE